VAIPSLVSSDNSIYTLFYPIGANDFVREMLSIFDGLPHEQMPWEVYADIVGGVNLYYAEEHNEVLRSRALWYQEILQMKSPEHPTPLDQELIDLIVREFRGVNEVTCP
jgi:hypothetical protein